MKKEINQELIQKLPQDLRSTESLLEYIEKLENEIKRLNKEQEDTFHIVVTYQGIKYDVDTQIKREFKDGEYVHLADDGQNPTKVEILGTKVFCTGIDQDFIITETIYNPNTNKTEERLYQSLYKKKKDAIEAYYNYHYGQLYQQSPAYKKYLKESGDK